MGRGIWLCCSLNAHVHLCTRLGLLLPYPSANLALDLIMLFLYLGIEVTRIFFGEYGIQ